MWLEPDFPRADLDFMTWPHLHPCHGGGVEYVVCDLSDELLYIGSTTDLQVRMRAHWREYGFSIGRNIIRWRQVLAPIVGKSLEYWLIREYRPPLNQHGHGKR